MSNHNFAIGDTVSYVAWEGTKCIRKIEIIHEEVNLATLSHGEVIMLENLTFIPHKPIDFWSLQLSKKVSTKIGS